MNTDAKISSYVGGERLPKREACIHSWRERGAVETSTYTHGLIGGHLQGDSSITYIGVDIEHSWA